VQAGHGSVIESVPGSRFWSRQAGRQFLGAFCVQATQVIGRKEWDQPWLPGPGFYGSKPLSLDILGALNRVQARVQCPPLAWVPPGVAGIRIYTGLQVANPYWKVEVASFHRF